jgi:squalene-hopene/tetraprenyl-beta-curcumene cyclase
MASAFEQVMTFLDFDRLLPALGPTQVIYVANGLAQWDAHVTNQLSPQTRQALELMFEIQGENGAWAPPARCWPPFESDSYCGTCFALLALSSCDAF